MKGIILAGGRGSRLYPLTTATCKQFLPIYDKPLIYYPLSVLMEAHIQDILIISTREDSPRFQQLFGDGSHLGLNISYAVQEKPEGIAQAFVIAESFIAGESVALVLGDNLFYGHQLKDILADCHLLTEGALIFGYHVADPWRYGVVDFNDKLQVISIEEKPAHPKTSYAVTGLYFYDRDVVNIAKSLSPSPRGEFEITDVNLAYLQKGSLSLKILEKGIAWMDTGTHESFHKAANYVQNVQENQGVMVACIEEIAYRMGYIDKQAFMKLIKEYPSSGYSSYLKKLEL
ncbi:MAG: glucose-1-phosphate thymidylyltransferase RfbA [Rhabdochlamydiaceae bacterium]